MNQKNHKENLNVNGEIGIIGHKPLQLNLVEIFASVQGETSYQGLPTTFIRLAACNLRCSWCDTTYSFGRGTPYTLDKIIDEVSSNGCPYVCVTGGEPLLQTNVHLLMSQLCDKGFFVSLETSGSLPTHQVDKRIKVILDIKCPGSGMSEKNCWQTIDCLKPGDEIKFVLADANDYQWSREICDKYALYEKPVEILLSPVHGVLNPQELVKWMLRDRLKVRLNLQIHKFIWSPETKGV